MGLLGHDAMLLSLAELAGLAGLAVVVAGRRTGLAGLGVLAMAGSPPVHAWSERSFTGHMVQHLALMTVAAPLLAVAVTGRRARRPARRPLEWRIGRLVSPPLAPLVAAGVHVGVVVAWHLPPAYDLALREAAVHAVEHATLLASALWWWVTVLHHLRRRRPFAPVLSLFAVATACAGLGVVLLFSDTAWYAHDVARPVDDQRTAGALMAGSGVVAGGAALVLVSRAVAALAEPGRPRIPTPLLALAPLAVAVPLAALVPPAAEAQPEAGAGMETPDAGRELYLRDCVSCHGPDGQGTFRGAPLGSVAAVRYSIGTGRMPIADPGQAVRRGPVGYRPDEIDALVDYTAQLVNGPGVPDLDGVPADVVAGGALYRLHCSPCHGATGIGGALTYEGRTPSVREADTIDVATAMAAGPGAMPAFAATFDEADIASVAAYVDLLADPVTTGVPLLGDRVSEGLVAWAVVGLLLLALAYTGRTAP